jgi:hypothetical protein
MLLYLLFFFGYLQRVPDSFPNDAILDVGLGDAKRVAGAGTAEFLAFQYEFVHSQHFSQMVWEVSSQGVIKVSARQDRKKKG